MAKPIRIEKVQKNAAGEVTRVRIVFGPHHFLEVDSQGEKTSFVVGYTHHGFRADASDPSGPLERIIDEVRERHPEWRVD